MANSFTVTTTHKSSIGSKFMVMGTVTCVLDGSNSVADGIQLETDAAGFRKRIQLPDTVDMVLCQACVAENGDPTDGYLVSLTSSGLLNFYSVAGTPATGYGLIERGAAALATGSGSTIVIPFIAIGF